MSSSAGDTVGISMSCHSEVDTSPSRVHNDDKHALGVAPECRFLEEH